MDNKKSVQLDAETKMPSVGLGTFMAAPEEIDATLTVAIEDAGYRHVDTSMLYVNEKDIGNSLQRILSAGKVTRNELFIVTKLPSCAMRPNDVEPYLRKSLDDLKLDYLDLYLVHLPCGSTNRGFDRILEKDEHGSLVFEFDPTTDHVAIWKKLEEMVDKGLTRAIGLSNFNQRQIQRVLDAARIKPANLQVECHAYLQQRELHAFCRERGITFTAYAPLGSRGLRKFVKENRRSDIETPALLEDPVLKTIAAGHKKSVAQVLLRWLVDRGIAVIPKSTNPKRIRENIDIWDFELSKDDTETIDGLDRKHRIFVMAPMCGMENHPEYPF